jgi:hypothetical protein
VKFRVICARTREPLGEFEAANYDDAAEKGKVYENSTRHTIVFPVPEEARSITEIKVNMPITGEQSQLSESDERWFARSVEDHRFVGIDFGVEEGETAIVVKLQAAELVLSIWARDKFKLSDDYVARVFVANNDLVVLVSKRSAKHAPGNGASPGMPEGASGKDAG